MKKVMIFIDGSNVFFDWQKVNPNKNEKFDPYNYIQLVKEKVKTKYAEADIDVEFGRTYYFATETEKNKKVFAYLKKQPYVDVKLGYLDNQDINITEKNELICEECHKIVTGPTHIEKDKGTDVNIAVEMLMRGFQKEYDIAVLATRDADFISVIEALKKIGRNVEIVLFDDENTKKTKLTDHADDQILIFKNEYAQCFQKQSTEKGDGLC